MGKKYLEQEIASVSLMKGTYRLPLKIKTHKL